MFTRSRVDSIKLCASCSCLFLIEGIALATIVQFLMYMYAFKCISCIDLLCKFINTFLIHRYSLPIIFILMWSVLLLRKSLVIVTKSSLFSIMIILNPFWPVSSVWVGHFPHTAVRPFRLFWDRALYWKRRLHDHTMLYHTILSQIHSRILHNIRCFWWY